MFFFTLLLLQIIYIYIYFGFKFFDQMAPSSISGLIKQSHQGKGGDTYTYDATVYSNTRAPTKVNMDMKYVFLDAAAQCDEKSVQLLLEGPEKIDPDTANADGLTALHQAAIENSMKCASLLVQNKAAVDAKDNDWWTPLHAAAACGHWCVILISHSKKKAKESFVFDTSNSAQGYCGLCFRWELRDPVRSIVTLSRRALPVLRVWFVRAPTKC